MSEIWTYNGRDITTIVADFHMTAGRFNGFEHMPKASHLIDRILGADGWYKAEFEKDGIKSKIWEFRNSCPFDNFLNFIEIKSDSERVYFARVHKNDASVHIDQKVCTDTQWVKKIVELTKRYNSSN